MYRNAAQLSVHDVALTGVNTDANADPELRDPLDNRNRGANGTRRAVERRKKTIARRVDFATPKALEFLADEGVVRLQQLAPLIVAQLHGLARSVHDVREKDGGEDAINVGSRACPREELFDLAEERVLIPEERIVFFSW